jgi:hypothetical protein
MSLVYINQKEGNTQPEHFQADSTEQKVIEVKIVGSNPIISIETDSTNKTTTFDMLTEGLW